MKIEKGQIFKTSWGYDQTNYDYIIVIEVSPTGKTAICRRTSHEQVGATQQTYEQKPVNKPFGDKFRLKVSYRDNVPELRGSYPFLHTGEGSKRYGWFSKVSEGQTFHETNPIFGH